MDLDIYGSGNMILAFLWGNIVREMPLMVYMFVESLTFLTA